MKLTTLTLVVVFAALLSLSETSLIGTTCKADSECDTANNEECKDAKACACKDGANCNAACDDASVCKNNGLCDKIGSTDTCNCANTGFEGPTCELAAACDDASVCKNNGVCEKIGSTDTCNCANTGFGGPTCEAAACDDATVCKNNGVCEKIGSTDTCNCADTGFGGPTCELAAETTTPAKGTRSTEAIGLLTTILISVLGMFFM